MLHFQLGAGRSFTKEKFGGRRRKEGDFQTNVCEYFEVTSVNLRGLHAVSVNGNCICDANKSYPVNLQNKPAPTFNFKKHLVERISCSC